MSEQAVPIAFPAPAVTDDAPAATTRSFVFHAKLIGSLTFISRLLGMARESMAAAYFGGAPVYAAFQFAFTIPNLFRKLLGEGALSAAFIPLYAQAVKQEKTPDGKNRDGDGFYISRSANDFAATSVNLLCGILLALTVVGEGILFALVSLLDMPWDYLLAAKLTMVMLPYVLLVCGTAFLGSILQVHERFAAITFTAVISNLCLIIAMILAARLLDLSSRPGQERAVYWLAVSVIVSGAIQVVSLLPSLRAAGFRFRAIFRVLTPAVRKMLVMTVPVALGAAVLQISVLMDKAIAFFLSAGPGRTVFELFGNTISYPMAEGATQRLNWAQFMYQFPLGIFAIALATAIFPKLSEGALDLDRTQFKSVLRRGIEASLFIGLPASIGLVVVRYPAVRLLFERGNFTPEDTILVARSTGLYAAAIWAFSLQQILNRAYYALHDTTTPLVLGVVNLAINLVVEIPLLWTPLAEAGMAAGTLVAFAIQAIVMVWMLDRRVAGLGLSAILPSIAKMLIAAAAMGFACFAVQRLPFYPDDTTTSASAMQLGILMLTGGATYFLTCAALGMDVWGKAPTSKSQIPNKPQ
ncbi:MAG TPA: murein biosynthesis integral membrane protein MurJ [Tepidisphaeraceae bacterium]|nr:murein biosynthesis integral membrane protein MurJ [Tepidisphaeraceae bacterium]